MKYIKKYYNLNDYKSILNHFFRLFITENLLNMSENDFYNIFNNSIYKLSHDLINKNIKSDKILFLNIRNEIIFQIKTNKDLKEILKSHGYNINDISFKSDDYLRLNSINYDFFRLNLK